MDDETSDYEQNRLSGPQSLSTICSLVIEGLERDFGEIVPFEMLLAIERHMGWQTEIVVMRTDTENALIDRHGSFDSHIMEKVLATKTWEKFRMKVENLSRRYLDLAIDEVVQRELQDTHPPSDPLL